MKEKKFTIRVITDEKGKVTFKRENEGFDAFELVGVLEVLQQEVIDIMNGANEAK